MRWASGTLAVRKIVRPFSAILSAAKDLKRLEAALV
jgi:hypothetical protein